MKKGKRYLLLSIFIMVHLCYPPDTAVAAEPDLPSAEQEAPPAPESVSESSLDVEPELQPEPDAISSAAELIGWLEAHKYSGGRAALTGDITMSESYIFVPYPKMPPLSVETGKYTIFVCTDTEFWSDGHLTFSGEGGERGIFHVRRGGMLLLDGVTVETTVDGDSRYALWQEEGAGMILGNTYVSCHVTGDIHYAEAPLVTEAENICVVVEKGELLGDRLPTEVTCRVNEQGTVLEHKPVAVTWDMEGTEKQQEERLRFQAQGVLPQAVDGVKPVCTVVYNDFPLTFTSVEAFVRGGAYTFRGGFTRQEGAISAVVLPEYSFDGENWSGEGENGIFNASSGFCLAFPLDWWDVSSNPCIYIRLRGEAGEQVYYSNVLRYAANNMDAAEDLGGSRGGGTSIVDPPKEPEKPGESGKPEEPERPGESGKLEEPVKPGGTQKPAEPEKPKKKENVDEPNAQEETREPGKSEQPAEPERHAISEQAKEAKPQEKTAEPDKTEQPPKAPEPAKAKTDQSPAGSFGQSNREDEAEKKFGHVQSAESGLTAENTDGGRRDFAAREMSAGMETNVDAEVQTEPPAQTEAGNVEAGQTENYGLMVGIVVLSAAAGAIGFSVSKSRGTKR